jgi:hypothetical protein
LDNVGGEKATSKNDGPTVHLQIGIAESIDTPRPQSTTQGGEGGGAGARADDQYVHNPFVHLRSFSRKVALGVQASL